MISSRSLQRILLAFQCIKLVNCLARRLSGRLQPRISWKLLQPPLPKYLKAFSRRPLGRIAGATAASGESLYIFGGETDNLGKVPNRFLNDLWEFTPDDSTTGGTWVSLTSHGAAGSPPARVSASMIYSDGKLILFGGISRISPVENVLLGDVWSFDVSRGTWSEISAFGGPGPLAAHTAILTDGAPNLMVVFGGYSASNINNDNIWMYSLKHSTWAAQETLNKKPGARNFHTAVAIPACDDFAMWGGIEDPQVWTYSIEASTWSNITTNLQYLSGRSGTVINRRVISFGGFGICSGPAYTNVVQVLHADGTWLDALPSTSAMPDGRCYATLISLKGYVYMYGGYRRSQSDSGERYSEERLSDLWRFSFGDD